MGAFLDKPVTDKHTEKGEFHGLKYALSAMQGWRKDMEDAHICASIPGWSNWSFFGVFDGHAGASVSKLLQEELLEKIVSETTFAGKGDELIEKVTTGTIKGFLAFDNGLQKKPDFSEDKDKGGSTAVTAFVSPSHIIWANCGDSRGFLCRNEKVAFATADHKPTNPMEKQRIERAGGTVLNLRVNGTLAVSRALGDFEYKKVSSLPAEAQLVSPEPDVTAIKREEGDEFLFLACDGVFDVMKNEDICKYIHRQLALTSDLTSICNNLLDLCLNKNSRDNMSAILVTFPGAPKVSEKAIEEQAESDIKTRLDIEKELKVQVDLASNLVEVDEMAVIPKLIENLDIPDDHIYSRKKWICERLDELKMEKFGKQGELEDRDMMDSSDFPGQPIHVNVFTAQAITEDAMIPTNDMDQDQRGDNPFPPVPQGTSVDGPSSN